MSIAYQSSDMASLPSTEPSCKCCWSFALSSTSDALLEDDCFQRGDTLRTGNMQRRHLASSDGLSRQESHCISRPGLAKSVLGGMSRAGIFSSQLYSSNLSVVSEDRPWNNADDDGDEDVSSLSSSSSSGGCSSCSFEDFSEVQSHYKGALADMGSLEDALPCKRGLSGYFSGKSRSFSCLADVASVKDLAKPKNPYAKKRKFISACIGNVEKSYLHPMRNRPSGKCKKSFHNNSYAIALTLSTEDGKPRNPVSSRSYSLSDLQDAENSCFTG